MMKVRFNWSRTLFDFSESKEVKGAAPQNESIGYGIVGIVGVDAGTILEMEVGQHPYSPVTLKYMVVTGSIIGIDKQTFDHWVERGRVETLSK